VTIFAQAWLLNVSPKSLILKFELFFNGFLLFVSPASSLFITDFSSFFVRTTTDPYQTPTVGHSKSGWDSTSGSYYAASLENGGVTILSKWPIKQKHQFVYKKACGSDW